MTDAMGPLDEETVLSMRAILDMVGIVVRSDGADSRQALEAWTAVHGGREVHIRVQADGSLDTSDLEALNRGYVAAGCHAMWLLLAYVSERIGVPAAELLDDFERDLVGDDE